MANSPKTMQQIRMILQQLQKGISHRRIARSLNISRNTVKYYVDRFLASSFSFQELLGLEDEALSALVYKQECSITTSEALSAGPGYPGPAESAHRPSDFEKQVPYFLKELGRKGVTRMLLWQEYIGQNPDGYRYTQFCERLSRHQQLRGASMHFEHHPGQVLMIDFAGDTLGYVNPDTGEWVTCPVFVGVLPFSGYGYVCALANAAIPQVVSALNQCLEFFNGVPQTVKCDNMRQMVSKSCRYEPVFTEVFNQWALHYNIALTAARVGKPKDKAHVENLVKITYQRIYAPLRNQTFKSLDELNRGIGHQLDLHHQTLLQRKNYNRSQCFLMHEQPVLSALPASSFRLRHSVQAKVQKNYHVTLGEDWHHYSVPYQYIGKTLQVNYDTDVVEIFHQYQRVALHVRSFKKHGYTTVKEHMPEGHQKFFEARGWDQDYFLAQAQRIGPSVHQYLSQVLKTRLFTEQTYNTCLGLIRLGRDYSHQRLENACKRALLGNRFTYRVVADILAHNLDEQPLPAGEGQQTELFRVPEHSNIRGKENYQ